MKKMMMTLLLLMVTAVSFAQSRVVIAGDGVCLRSQPSEDYKMLNSPVRLYTGEEYACAGKVNGYYKIKYSGDYYYIPTKYARPRGSQATAVDHDYVIVAGDRVIPRSKPDEQHKMTKSSLRFNTGDVLRCTGKSGNYYRVSVNGSIYYIPTKYARPRY